MIVSYNWLKELIKINKAPEQLVNEMSLHSTEVETLTKLSTATKIVVGLVESCVPHENSDHLHVCMVNLGDNTSQIVCGAPNVACGQKVMVALPGAVLPGGVIKASKVRGVDSFGMICSLQELGIENKYVPEKFQNGIYVLPNSAKLGEDAIKFLGLDDYQIELSLTPNRMDLMSMLGVAHDIKAMYNEPINYPKCELKEVTTKTSDEIKVKLETSNCYSYYARVVKNVVIKDSPLFMKERLIAAGIRPINNVVDITNYILVLFGQPLHAFDKDLLGDTITVRRAKDGEKLVTLDDNERTLCKSDIVISDGENGERAICLAGVMGGKSTEVTENTRNLVLESAVFRPLSVRKTSNRLGLRSESSARYERGVDLNQSLDAVNYACYLLSEYADAEIAEGYVHEGTSHIDDTAITITSKYVEDYLGIPISKEEIVNIIERLDFKVTVNDENITAKVPNRRMDVKIKQDLVEEIARIKGYENLAETLPKMSVSSVTSNADKVKSIINNCLVETGLSEVVTYSLVSKKLADEFKILYSDENEPISLLHPLTDEHAILRRTLVSSLIEVLKYNNARKIKDQAIYEIGKGYYLADEKAYEVPLLAGAIQGKQNVLPWMQKEDAVDFYYVKGILEKLFTRLSMNVKYINLESCPKELHPGRTAGIVYGKKLIGYIGALHPQYQKKADIDQTYVFEINLKDILGIQRKTIAFKEIIKVPSVERDLALVMAKNQLVGEVIDAIYRCDKNMIKKVSVFDVYEGNNIDDSLKSVAVRITLESNETLTDEVINGKIKKILNTLSYCYKITLRQ